MSTSVDSLYSSSSRITSLVSDMDTDSIVKNLCSGQQSKIDKQYQKQTTYQWEDDAWKDISDAVTDFSDTYVSSLGSSSMLKTATYMAFKVNTSDTSGAVKITADSNATASNVTVSVQQVAKNATVSGSTGISKNGELSAYNTTKLSELGFATPLKFGPDQKLSFSINGKTFSFASDATLQSMISTVNSDTDANVTMKYSRLTDSFTITADDGGADSEVILKNFSGNAFGTGGAFGLAEGTIRNGQNAKVTINDGTLEAGVSVEKDSNSFTIDGLTYEINDKTDGNISFQVERDYSSTVDAVQKFVDALNTLMTKVSGYTTAKDYSDDYPPLTEAQKDDMKDDQIKNWEDKAKSGVLRHNSALEGLVTSLKNAFYSTAGGTGTNATAIGITTAGFFDDNSGQLTVNTDALEKALASDPEKVINLFTAGNTHSSSDQQGIMYKLRNVINSFDDTADDKLDTLGKNITSSAKTIKSQKTKLKDMADRYYKKFSDMETSLSKLNSSANMISSMFSS